ncbi:MAG: TetR/AcrR family transcriptional regulator, partial [Bacteroidia bacterium]|nr:TetR/AcrR family transcriptional regulator [Bacteroidia bacterium]
DDIARELGISKKTIYKHFADKKDLVNQIFEGTINKEREACDSCYNSGENAIRKMIDLSKMISSGHKEMNASVLFDLRKYYPSLWRKFEEFRTGFIATSIKQNIEEGQTKNLYRDNINSDIVAGFYITLIQGMMKMLSDTKTNYDFQTLHRNMVYYHLYGICSPVGLEYLEQHINEI